MKVERMVLFDVIGQVPLYLVDRRTGSYDEALDRRMTLAELEYGAKGFYVVGVNPCPAVVR